MSQTIISTIIGLLAILLPKIGLEIGSDQLTTTITTIVAIVSFLWIWIRRVTQNNDVNAVGIKK